jgi:hypothetical protein
MRARSPRDMRGGDAGRRSRGGVQPAAIYQPPCARACWAACRGMLRVLSRSWRAVAPHSQPRAAPTRCWSRPWGDGWRAPNRRPAGARGAACSDPAQDAAERRRHHRPSAHQTAGVRGPGQQQGADPPRAAAGISSAAPSPAAAAPPAGAPAAGGSCQSQPACRGRGAPQQRRRLCARAAAACGPQGAQAAGPTPAWQPGRRAGGGGCLRGAGARAGHAPAPPPQAAPRSGRSPLAQRYRGRGRRSTLIGLSLTALRPADSGAAGARRGGPKACACRALLGRSARPGAAGRASARGDAGDAAPSRAGAARVGPRARGGPRCSSRGGALGGRAARIWFWSGPKMS